MSKYGYVGKESDIPQQAFKANAGVLSVNDHLALNQENKLTQYGQLELIETQTLTSGNTLDFTDIKQDIYNVHFLTGNDIESAFANTAISIRLSNDNGSTFESSNYQYALQYMGVNGVFGESKSTTASEMRFMSDSANENKGGYSYLYNLGSSKYSYATSQAMEHTYAQFSSSVYTVAETINAIRILTPNSNAWTGTLSLYGIRYS